MIHIYAAMSKIVHAYTQIHELVKLDLERTKHVCAGQQCKPEKCSPFESLKIVNIINCLQLWKKCLGKFC